MRHDAIIVDGSFTGLSAVIRGFTENAAPLEPCITPRPQVAP